MTNLTNLAAAWAKTNQSKSVAEIDDSLFHRNLEKALNKRREQHFLLPLHTFSDKMIDFSSADTLGLGSSGILRSAFLEELRRNPNFRVGACGTRLMYANSEYHENLEREVAAFHRSEAALVAVNATTANRGIFTAIPQPGDAIVYDELIHASIRDALKDCQARIQKTFAHNDPESLKQALMDIRNTHSVLYNGEQSVFIAMEGVYSMDGDIPPCETYIAIARELFPKGNVQFFIDEAHSTANIGPQGRGLVCALGLEKEFSLRVHTCAKGLGSHGAMILCSHTVKAVLLNKAGNFLFSGAPSFPMLAAIKVGYGLLKAGETEQAQRRITLIGKLFRNTITSHPVWARAQEANILRVPLWEKDEPGRDFVTTICPIWTRGNTRHCFYLAFHLQLAGFIIYPLVFPVVPKGKERIRVVFNSGRSDEEVIALANCVCAWAEEMLEIDALGGGAEVLPRAAQLVYANQEGLEVGRIASKL